MNVTNYVKGEMHLGIKCIQRYDVGYVAVNYDYDTGFLYFRDRSIIEPSEGCYLEVQVMEVTGVTLEANSSAIYINESYDIQLNIKDMKGYSNKYRFKKGSYLQIKERNIDGGSEHC